MTSESASTHVVSRIVMARVMALIRTGKEFGPFPADVLDSAQNPLVSTFVEFVSLDNAATGQRQITRIERRTGTTSPPGSWGPRLLGTEGLAGRPGLGLRRLRFPGLGSPARRRRGRSRARGRRP